MTPRNPSAIHRQIRELFTVGTLGELTDGQLLERFASARGEAGELAFARLVERHGAMVLRVCRGVLADPADTEDAFQATFLVLVRKARGLWVHDSIGPWLHQVAYRTALGARKAAARRCRHERNAALSAPGHRDDPDHELRRLLHEEIARLPERFRAPIVLCDLDGHSHEQAARHLGCPVGTVKSRISRGRERLKERLIGRGVDPDSGLLALALGPPGVAPSVVDATARLALQFSTVRAVVPAAVALLAQEVLGTMAMTRWIKVATLLAATFATVSGARLLAQNPPAKPAIAGRPTTIQNPNTPVRNAVAGPFRFVLEYRGNLEAASSNDVYCEVEGQTTLLKLVDEGTRVNKGDVIAQLDDAALKDRLVNQAITTRAAEAAYQDAKVAREIAELATVEFLEGTSKLEWAAIKNEINGSSEALKRAEARVERTRHARDQARHGPGVFDPPVALANVELDDRLDAAELAVQRERWAVEAAETRLMVLQKYTKPRTVMELKSTVERKKSEELARQAAWDLEKSKQAKLVKQIAACKIVAPSTGLLVYANDPNRVRPQAQIEEGASVRERQKLFSIPDLSAMVVNTKVHEAWVDQVVPRQKATIKVDAFPYETFMGVVETVAPLPDPTSFFNSDVKVYTTRIKLDKPIPGLRPGMTASAHIVIFEREHVLQVPVEWVVTLDRKTYVAVKKDGQFEWRAVVLGATNDKTVEVKEGLTTDELIAVNPVNLLTEQEKLELKLNDQARPGAKPAAKAAGKSIGSMPFLQKLQNLSPEDRQRFRSASQAEREAILRKAGSTESELEQMRRARGQSQQKQGPGQPE